LEALRSEALGKNYPSNSSWGGRRVESSLLAEREGLVDSLLFHKAVYWDVKLGSAWKDAKVFPLGKPCHAFSGSIKKCRVRASLP